MSETFFMEQKDGTWHKMCFPDGVERKLENAVFQGKYRQLDTDLKKNPKVFEELEDREDVEFFFGPGSYGIPSMIWVEKVSDSP
jgi:hypothetical protein